MKTMTCKELGGECAAKMSAVFWEDMVKLITAHIMQKHPEIAARMKNVSPEDLRRLGAEMKAKWDAKPAERIA